MDEDDQVNVAVRRAAKRFQRRRERQPQPSQNLLQVLKKSREAAGMPLNAIAMETEKEEPTREATPLVEESPLQEVISSPPIRSRSIERPKSVRDYVTVEPDWNGGQSNERSWQDNKTLIECNLYMLAQEIGCDVIVLVGEGQEAIQAHSFVLSSRSVKFADILAADKQLDNKLIVIPEAKTDTFRSLLRYLYTDDIELSIELATTLIPLTSTYGPTSLQTSCFHYLLSEINSDNVCVTLELAHAHNEKAVYDRCMSFVLVNAVDVLMSTNFEKLCRECVDNLTKSDYLNAKEYVVFEALTKWASRKCSQKRIQPSDVNKRKVLDKLLYHVRFATMDVLEFTQKISKSEVLDREEKIALYQYFHGETHVLPPPFDKRARHEYVVNHDLITRALGKGKAKAYTPDSLPLTELRLIPYEQKEEHETYKHKEYEKSRPIKRVVRFQGLDKNWELRGPDAIGFRVSRQVTVHGVQMFGPFFGQDTYNVNIVVYDHHGDVQCYETKTVVTGKTLKVYDVILTSPIQLPARQTFTVQLKIQGKPTFCGINGLESVDKDGVNFQFFDSNKSLNGTGIRIGQIPTILFS